MLSLLLAAALGTAQSSFELVLISREGGINPGVETIAFDGSGAIRTTRQRLVPAEPIVTTGHAGEDTLRSVRGLLSQAGFLELPERLNEAQGVGVAFDWELRVSENGTSHTVRAFRFGEPPPDPIFVSLVRALRELLLPLASTPAP